MTETVWQRATDWVGTEVEGSFVMINLETGTYLTLNRTASAVWNLLETPQTQDQLERHLTDRFEVSAEECSAAVAKLLGQMRDQKLASPA
jgi:hypothetical protein